MSGVTKLSHSIDEVNVTTRTHERRKAIPRNAVDAPVVVTFAEDTGQFRTVSGRAVNECEGGFAILLPLALEIGTFVRIEEAHEGSPRRKFGDAFIRWCNRQNGKFLTGAMNAGTCRVNDPGLTSDFDENPYEILQVNTNADPDTIHRVYRILATRYHPDNAETGDSERFQKLVAAYRILSNPETRAAIDVCHRQRDRRHWSIFESASVTTGAAAEKRKRAALLQAFYAKRAADPDQAALSIRDLEDVLGCPREHLQFPLWYLKEGGYIVRSDNSKYQITIKGAELAEKTDEEFRGNHMPPQIESA